MSRSPRPLVSIATPTLQRADYLKRTRRSACAGRYPNVEHITVDGGSMDGTLEFLGRHAGTYSLRWISERNRGMFDPVGNRVRGTMVPLVCTGLQNPHFDTIRCAVGELELSDQVHSLGYGDARLADLHRAAVALVYPNTFEGWGLLVVEAFALGLPVVCSSVTVLPEVAGDAAVLFDPDDTAAMADAIGRIWTDARLRADLAARVRARAASLNWDRTARAFRHVAGQHLPDGDRSLLRPPMLVP